MRGETHREVAVELEVIIVSVVAQAAVAVHGQYPEVVAHTQRTLQPAEFRLVQEVSAHGKGSEVGHESRLLGAGIVEVGLVGVGEPGIRRHLPQFPLRVPEHIELVGLQHQVLHRNPAPLRLLPVLELLAQVLLERQREVELMVLADVPFQLPLQRHVLRLLERRLDLVGEGLDRLRVRPAVFKAFDQL